MNWCNKVPIDFKFCPKMSRFITHMKKLNDPDVPLQKFFDIFDLMKDRLGPVLIQIPPSLSFNREKVDFFFKKLWKKWRCEGVRLAI